MDFLSLISQVIKSVAWPVTVLILIFLLRKPIRRLIPLLESLKYRDLELHFRHQLEILKQEMPVEQEKEGKLTEVDIHTVKLAELSPRAAIQEAWFQIETAARKKISELLPKEQRKSKPMREAVHYLEFSGTLTPVTAKALRDIYLLRSQAAHSPEFSLTSSDALEYVSIARQIQRQIEAISQLPKVKLRALTLLILEINHLIDTGRYNDITISDIHIEIERGTVLRYLNEKPGKDIDLSLFLKSDTYPGFEQYYSEQLQNLYNAYKGDERRKWGVENLGLCLLLAWTNEIIQQGSGWYPND